MSQRCGKLIPIRRNHCGFCNVDRLGAASIGWGQLKSAGGMYREGTVEANNGWW